MGEIVVRKVSRQDKMFYNIVYKFEVSGSKYRIKEHLLVFELQYCPIGSRIYRHAKNFHTLEEAKNYIYNSECPQ